MKKLFPTLPILLMVLFNISSLNVYAQNNYSTIHFLAYTTYKPLIGQSLKLSFNDRLAASVRYGEAIHYKMYSEGRIAITSSLILDVENGKDYYIYFFFKGNIAGQELAQIDSLKWYSLKTAQCKYESNFEEDITRPWGIINTKKATGPKSGTCFLISDKGYFITNYHVVENAKEITIKGIDGDFTTKYGATVIAEDQSNDLALLKISNKNVQFSLPPFAIRTTGIAQGEKIYAYGYPLTTAMGNEIKLTDGIISAKSGVQGDASKFQISAAVQPGNSGGPLIDEQGNVIGVVYAKSTVADAASYAVKASYLETFLKEIDGFEFPQLINSINDKPLTDKVATLRNFIFIVETN
ncbi:MAG: serine protease [Chitinophagales bacterium]|nr:serine protease [Chitinophagales bacterium]